MAHKTFTLTMLVLVLAIPSIASAQLSAHERVRAQEYARIQAKADAEERAKNDKMHRDSAQTLCRTSNRFWDYANGTCIESPLRSPR